MYTPTQADMQKLVEMGKEAHNTVGLVRDVTAYAQGLATAVGVDVVDVLTGLLGTGVIKAKPRE